MRRCGETEREREESLYFDFHFLSNTVTKLHPGGFLNFLTTHNFTASFSAFDWQCGEHRPVTQRGRAGKKKEKTKHRHILISTSLLPGTFILFKCVVICGNPLFRIFSSSLPWQNGTVDFMGI
jgi:hypothetical protein